MLSDREREALQEIQRQFADEDPDLARQLSSAGPTGPGERPRRVAYTVATVLSGVLTFIMLAVESAVGTLVFVTAAIVFGALLYRAINSGAISSDATDRSAP